MLKKMTYLHLRAFLSFHTCSLTALEPKLTEVVWRARKSWSSGAEDRWTFSEAQRALRSFLMAPREFPHYIIYGIKTRAQLRIWRNIKQTGFVPFHSSVMLAIPPAAWSNPILAEGSLVQFRTLLGMLTGRPGEYIWFSFDRHDWLLCRLG